MTSVDIGGIGPALPEVQRTRRTVSFDVDHHESRAGGSQSPSASLTRSARTFREGNLPAEQESTATALLLGCKLLIGVLFFVIVLASSVLSKLTLVRLTDSLRNSSGILNETFDSKKRSSAQEKQMARVYWQLLLVLLIPNALTFLRSLFFGTLGKTRKSYPWPRWRAVALGCIGALVEVIAISSLLFLIMTELSPGESILILNGVFMAQTIIDAYSAFRKCKEDDGCTVQRHGNRNGYEDVNGANHGNQEAERLLNKDADEENVRTTTRILRRLQCLLDSYVVKVLAALLQFAGIFGVVAFFVYMMVKGSSKKTKYDSVYMRPVIGLPLVLITLSIIWSNRFQEAISRAKAKNATARYKSSLIYSGLRIILYPFVTYVIFRYIAPFDMDPWCLHSSDCSVSFSGETRDEMIVHIVMSFVGYFVVWVSCTMTLSQLSVGIPLLLSTPIAVGVYYILYATRSDYSGFLSFQADHKVFLHYFPGVPIISSLLWIAELLAMGFYICVKTNIILAKDQDMFLTPHYDSVFLEQYTILNRQVKKGRRKQDEGDDSMIMVKRRNPRMIFICSTMYRESDYEMKQMLESINRVALHYESEYRKGEACCDRYESHIFFDGAINANQIEDFGLQLLSLLKETLSINLRECIKKKTPYGYRLSWKLGGAMKLMPFFIHFKDKQLVKPKKRWSQVMYMNYVLNYRIKTDTELVLQPDDTFILTTDADIDFKANSVVVLLDMLAPNTNVAAVCARTHPKGHGLLYWYQLFDYAIGHWFQKPAEHILGSVLCSPGCFSVFRCSALNKVLEEYSSEVHGASEFLMKDMGEDRWLCSLLIKQGLRLEYCAISEDQTYCPTEFNEFFKQRRRWIPSTVANLVMLVSESGIITRGNDSISILYILFQVIMVFSTAISPATVILVIAAGLDTFGIPYEFTVTILFLLSVVYGLICLYASPKAQLDISKLLAFVFALIMAVVIVGIFKDVVNDIIGPQYKIPIGPPGNCDRFLNGKNKTEEYYECIRGQDFALNFTNGQSDHFTMPVSMTVVYIGALSGTFAIASLFHLPEIHCLLHSIWFLLGLPAGYLLLLIYSAANLCDRSWGTREKNSGADEGLWGWRVYVLRAWKLVTSSVCCVKCCFPNQDKNVVSEKKEEEGVAKGGGEGGVAKDQEGKAGVVEEGEGEGGGGEGDDSVDDERREEEFTESTSVRHVGMAKAVEDWLIARGCEDYVGNFASFGYKNLSFLASMTAEDFQKIGIDKKGFVLRLERAVKQLHGLTMKYDNNHDVQQWLDSLELGEYTQVFNDDGYKWKEDIPNLKHLNEESLKRMGIVKRAHLQRLVKGLDFLKKQMSIDVNLNEMDRETADWLCNNDSKEYAEKFIAEGYTNKRFMAGIKAKDLKEIGIDKKGFRLKLEKAAQQLAPLPIRVDIPENVQKWLSDLELGEYTELFRKEGYKTGEDIVNLKELDEQQLRAMGITKRAHLKRLKVALDSLQIPSLLELNKRRTKITVEGLPDASLEDVEEDFWNDLIHRKLKPVPLKFTGSKNVQKSLESLRNSTLGLLLLVNLMWIVILGSLTFWQLEVYGIDPRAFQLLFLAVYGLIIIIQFFTMLAHRAVTLIHYLGRVKPREVTVNPWLIGAASGYDGRFEMVSYAQQA